jgi:predicted N-acyltransferase
VLEHVKNDETMVSEAARVLNPPGVFIATFPHRMAYFSNDDRFVNHFRRYERKDMKRLLQKAGMELVLVKKVLGVMDKIAMSLVVFGYQLMENRIRRKGSSPSLLSKSFFSRLAKPLFHMINYPVIIVAGLEAYLTPREMSAVLLIKSRRKNTIG